ncbi:wax ester/triacylglycerol synthase family O-acyltransferase [Speluncibacter jeojiensis]|uniref:Diacylglycerol O-acyltransferase n=1 Tax=Speluncibacter jeojiensis TaxID=2710754 RepID=A0A9X4M265_9ACTN|nr:wax ester/triacylglycerol synthase family O-acyltransferase [Corynebacteriales bacterium D3-21]
MLFPMSPRDSMFLLAEAAHRPMHVGGLAVFDPPGDADPDEAMALFAAAVERDRVAPVFGKRARRSVTTLGQWGWDHGVQADLDYHVHRSAVPSPGGTDELMGLVSWLHSSPLDLGRPPWELHLIEGLAGGRWAVYFKIHHALADGVGAMGLLRGALSTDPDLRGMPAPWEPALDQRPDTSAEMVAGRSGQGADLPGLPGAVFGAVRDAGIEAAGMVAAVAGTVDRALHGRGGTLSFSSPASVFNVPVRSGRGFAARSWPVERLRLVAKHADATINDVVMAMCSGALRRYLDALGALPERSLVAMVPVCLRSDRTDPDTGNKIGSLVCELATHVDDAAQRLASVRTRMREGKAALSARSGPQVLAMSALGAAPLALGMLAGGTRKLLRAPNVMISNVPGPSEPLYWNGYRLETLYPLSIPVDGQALNITCTGDQITFGLTGCRSAVPNIHTLPGHLDEELGTLELAVGL